MTSILFTRNPKVPWSFTPLDQVKEFKPVSKPLTASAKSYTPLKAPSQTQLLPTTTFSITKPYKEFKPHTESKGFQSKATYTSRFQRYELLTNVRDAKYVVDFFNKSPRVPICVDCEGVDLSRTGKLSTIQISLYRTQTAYIFDVLALGPKGLRQCGVKTLLESKTRLKIAFDCRNDSDALYYQLDIKLAPPLVDLQVMYIGIQQSRVKVPQWVTGYEKLLNSCSWCTNALTKEELYLKAKLRIMWKYQQAQWAQRPMDRDHLLYAACDVVAMSPLFDWFLREFGKSWHTHWRYRVMRGSDIYIQMYRNRQSPHKLTKMEKCIAIRI